MTREEALQRLHDAVTQDLLDRIESGKATAADLGVARQHLKDNGISSIPKTNNPIFRLAQALPFEDEREAV